MTPLVEGDGEELADVVARCTRRTARRRTRAAALEHEVDRQAARSGPGRCRRLDLVAAEQRRVGLAGRGPGRRVAWVVRRAGTKSSWPVWPTRRRTLSTSDTPGSSMTTRSLPWTRTTGSDTPVVFTRRSMMSLMTPMPRASGHAVLGQGLVLDPQAALEVEPELGLDEPPLAVGRRRIGQPQPGKKPMSRASTPMTTMRMGPALRIPAGCYTKAPRDCGECRHASALTRLRPRASP